MSKFTPFWRINEPNEECSQWYLSKFVEETDEKKVTFVSAEQYMMYHKAMLFSDQDVAAKILQTTDQKQIKALGRKVKGFNEDAWIKNRERIVYNGNFLKFTQNPKLLAYMKKNKSAYFVEASPLDDIWGIGYNAASALKNKDRWGLNLLGVALCKVRDTILNINTAADEKTNDVPDDTLDVLDDTLDSTEDISKLIRKNK